MFHVLNLLKLTQVIHVLLFSNASNACFSLMRKSTSFAFELLEKCTYSREER